MENEKDYGKAVLEAFHKFGAQDAEREYNSGRYETLLALLKAPVVASVQNVAEAEARADAARAREAAAEAGFRANEKKRAAVGREVCELEAKAQALEAKNAELSAENTRLEGNLATLRTILQKEAAA